MCITEEKVISAMKRDESYQEVSMTTHTIVSQIGYLIGVPENFFTENNYCMSRTIYDRMEKHRDARIVRNLCYLRSTCERGFLKIAREIIYELKNLHTIQLTSKTVQLLQEDGIDIVKSNPKMEDYIIKLNQLIRENIDNCQKLFPAWIEWEYLKELFIIKGGENVEKNKTVFSEYTSHTMIYPFQQFLVWKFQDGEGNILYNDEKFLKRLYAQHNDIFTSYETVRGAGKKVQNEIEKFISESSKISMVVDCENCDPIRLCAALDTMTKEEKDKLSGITLYNDVNASTAWTLLKDHTNATVTHNMTTRVKLNKSLVDVELVAGACKEHYQNNVDAFILCSSDSDFWGLIKSLPDAKFLLLVETNKVSADIISLLNEKNIPFCFLDQFCQAGESYGMKTEAMIWECKKYLSENKLPININEMLEVALSKTRITMSMREQQQFITRYIRTIHTIIDTNGNLTLSFGEV